MIDTLKDEACPPKCICDEKCNDMESIGFVDDISLGFYIAYCVFIYCCLALRLYWDASLISVA